jgi:hypothetical protein
MAIDIGKFLLVGGIGFVAYEMFFSAPATPAAAAPATGAAPPVAPVSGIVPASTAGLQSSIAALEADQNPPFTIGTADQHGYYYAEVAGKPATDPGSYLTAANRQETFALPAWCSASGLCGIVDFNAGMSGYFPTSRLSVFDEE